MFLKVKVDWIVTFVSSYIEITGNSLTFTEASGSLPWASVWNEFNSQLLMLSLRARKDVLAVLWIWYGLKFQVAGMGEKNSMRKRNI